MNKDNLVIEKRCSRCGETKSAFAFHRQSDKKDGLTSRCRKCTNEVTSTPEKREYQKNYNKSHPRKKKETIVLRVKKICGRCGFNKSVFAFSRNSTERDGLADWCRKCTNEWEKTEEQQKRRKEYNEERADIQKEYRIEYYKVNKVKLTEKGKIYREENKGKINERGRKYNKENPEIHRAAESRRRHRKTVNMDDTDRLLSVEYRKAIQNDKCFYCRERTEEMHDDHFFPIAKGGTDNWWNLVRACSPCNHHKAAHCGTWFILLEGVTVNHG